MQDADVAASIDELFAFTRGGRHPGAAVMVIRDGVIRHRRAYGLADLETSAPITGETCFYLCSLSKAFTAMAIMLLVEAGQVSYDDVLPRFFPEFPAYGRAITVRHLLHHTSGLPDHFQLSARPDLAELTGLTNQRVLDWLCRRDVTDFPAGERRQYSNAGYVLLAMIVDRASGQPFHCFMRDRMFAPLGMRRTLVYDESKPAVSRLAPAYAPLDRPDGEGYRRWDYNLLTSGGGGIFSCIDDLYRWDQALAREHLVSAATYQEAYTPGHLNDGSEFGYGFGWEIGQFRGRKQLAHTGGLASYHTRFLRFPDERLSVIVLGNTDRVDAVASAQQIAGWYFA